MWSDGGPFPNKATEMFALFPQWCPVAILALHLMPKCLETATSWGPLCVTAAWASGLWWEMPPACVDWTDTGQALSPTAQVWSVEYVQVAGGALTGRSMVHEHGGGHYSLGTRTPSFI